MKNYQNYLLDLENLKTSGYCFRETSNCEIQKMECIKRMSVIKRLNILKRTEMTEKDSREYSIALANILQEMLQLTKCEVQCGEKNQTKSLQSFYAEYNEIYDKIQCIFKDLKENMNDEKEVVRLINVVCEEILPLWCSMREYIVEIDKTSIIEQKEVNISE